MQENKKQDDVKRTKRYLPFLLGDRVDFDALIKKKGIILKDSPQEKELDKQN